jgi:hypothetical protein
VTITQVQNVSKLEDSEKKVILICNIAVTHKVTCLKVGKIFWLRPLEGFALHV